MDVIVDRRRVLNAQGLVAFSLGFDVPIWWFFLPLIGSDTMRLENTGERGSDLLLLLLGRQDQVELLRDRVATLRRTSDPSAVEEMRERVVGAKSWKHLEATRLLAIQELAYREASTIETLIGSLREVVAKFDGVFAEVVPGDVEMAAFMEWKSSQVYRKTSEVLLGKALFHKALDDDNKPRGRLDCSSHGKTSRWKTGSTPTTPSCWRVSPPCPNVSSTSLRTRSCRRLRTAFLIRIDATRSGR